MKKKDDWRLTHMNWCDYCDTFGSSECKLCKPPHVRKGYEGKRSSKLSVVPPSEWQAP